MGVGGGEREGIPVPSAEFLDGFSFPTLHKLQFALKFALKFKNRWEYWKVKREKYGLHNVSTFHPRQEPLKDRVLAELASLGRLEMRTSEARPGQLSTQARSPCQEGTQTLILTAACVRPDVQLV